MNLHRSILLLFLAFQISSPALEPRLNLPPEVRKKAEEQIISWFGTNQINGIPLLDTNVDWTVFKNWPDEITFEGKVHTMRITGISSDVMFGIAPRTKANPNYSIFVCYGEGGPWATWVSNRVMECGISIPRVFDTIKYKATVIGLSFRRNGNLVMFDYKEKIGGWWRRAFYDQTGKLLGYEEEKTWPDSEKWPFPIYAIWKGKQVSLERFHALAEPIMLWDTPMARDTGGSSASPPRRRQ
ncbi:MAG: hypothetical protein HZA89_11100 [Verrucomicrobia bacterium]|nr:hypothetical protein [Verrucomicrobiota bacterium]